MGFLRIEGGTLKGRFIKFDDTGSVRPLTSLIRKAIFDTINIQNLTVVDLFAGTGIFGFEALSRGAKFVLFIEKQKSLCKNIRENLKNLGLENSADIMCSESESALKKLSQQRFDLVFLDPPFNYKITQKLANSVLEISTWLTILRRRKGEDENYYCSLFNAKSVKIKHYADSTIFFFFTQKTQSPL